MANPGWGAVLRGEPSDLQDWVYALPIGSDPWIEVHETETVLRSSAMDQMTKAEEIRDAAVVLIDRLNGAVALSEGSGPVAFGGVIGFGPNGEVHRTVFPGTIEIKLSISKVRGFGQAIGSDGQPIHSPPQKTSVQKWFDFAQKDELLEDALIYFGRSNDWFDIYKCLECLIMRANSEANFFALNWVPEDQARLLKQTANWNRHARRKFDKPSKPMELKQARKVLAQLVRRALEDFEASTSA